MLRTCAWSALLIASAHWGCGIPARPVAPPPVVFIHGIKGSSLVSPTHEMRWLTITTALGLSTPDLRLPLIWENGVQGRDTLTPQAPLTEVSLIPGLVGEKIYGPFIAALQAMGHPYHPFAYDWRRDNLESLAALTHFVQEVRAQHGNAQVRLIAHSMGGLIAFALLNQHPEYFKDVVFAGVPFVGGIGFLDDLHVGTRAGRNSAILAPEVLFTFPSVYTFFPLNGVGLIEPDGTAIPMDFYAVEGWRRHGLGMFAARPDSLLSSAQVEDFLRQALPRAKAFRSLLVAQDVAYPPILVISSRSRPTVVRLVRNGPRSVLGWDFDSAPKEAGDGRVAATYSLPYPGIPYRVMYSEREHADLLNDPQVCQAIDALE